MTQLGSKLKQKITTGKLQIPDNVSSDARDLIESILQRNPSLRPSIRDILSHPWFQSGRVIGNLPEIDPTFDYRLAVDPKVVQQVRKFGFQEEFLLNSIYSLKLNAATACYYKLLLKS